MGRSRFPWYFGLVKRSPGASWSKYVEFHNGWNRKSWWQKTACVLVLLTVTNHRTGNSGPDQACSRNKHAPEETGKYPRAESPESPPGRGHVGTNRHATE